MAKAILELSKMPENCKECPLHSWRSNGYASTLICKILLVNGLPHKRREDCPLKLAENIAKITYTKVVQDDFILDLIDIIEALYMKYNHFKERLQISPYGDDKIDELDEALENCNFQYEQLKLENEQLRARVAQYREALRKAREMLHKGISELKVHCKYFDQTPEEDICIEMHEAIIEINKVIGGKEE